MKRFLRGCATVVLALVLLAVTAYVVHGAVGTLEVSRAESRAEQEVTSGLPDGRRRADQARDTVLAAVAGQGGRPTYSWQEVVCDLASVDAGWIVQSYTQECRIRTVDLVPVAAAGSEECAYQPLPVAPSSDGTVVPPLSVDARVGPSSAFDEQHPYRAGCPDGILAPPRSGATRLLSGSRPTSLDASPAWLVLTVDTDVSRTDLGCQPWVLVFCTEPVDGPVLGDLE